MYNSFDNRNEQGGSWQSSPSYSNYNSHQPSFEASGYRVEDAPKQQKKGRGRIVALALCCSLLGGAVGAGGVVLGGRMLQPVGTSNVLEGDRSLSVINVSQVDTNKLLTAAEVYAANVNSTVGITTSTVTTNYWGIPVSGAAAGSGFILSDDGYILTNYHVIEGATAVSVSMYDGTSYDASLVGYDASNDIAVLKIEAEGLKPVVLGDSSTINVGDDVVAIGNPLGELTFSLTKGTVSALDREITLSSGSSSNGTAGSITMSLMQTDCAINSGNSGGALFNMYGEVVGITNAKYSSKNSSSEASVDNIGFAIPINNVRNIVQSIIEKGYISKPYIAVTVSTVSQSEQTRYNMPQGAVIESVTEDGPAARAGLQTGDIVTHVNGQEIASHQELVSAVGECAPNETVTLTIYRQGQTQEISVTIGEQQQPAMGEGASQSQQQPSQQGQNDLFGSFPWGFGYGY